MDTLAAAGCISRRYTVPCCSVTRGAKAEGPTANSSSITSTEVRVLPCPVSLGVAWGKDSGPPATDGGKRGGED